MPTGDLVLLADPQITALAVAECGAPLRAIADGDGLVLDPRKRDPAGVHALARSGVLARLPTRDPARPTVTGAGVGCPAMALHGVLPPPRP